MGIKGGKVLRDCKFCQGAVLHIRNELIIFAIMEYKKVLNQIEQARTAQRMSKLELCKRAGINPSTYHRLLTGEGSITLEVFMRLCIGLGYSCRFEKTEVIDIW